MAYSPSEKYPGAVDVDPDYQGGKFRDNNPSTTNNGSPLKAIDRNELLARDEAIMNDAGFEYSGVADTPQDSQLFKAYKASLGNGANLLSNHNFLTQTPDDSQPLPSATPTSYPPGYQIFSGVFANETTGITNLTYIDGRVSFSGGDLYFAVPNTGSIERLADFAASVADFDGKPRTRGVSFALVGDEYRVTVGVDALEDVAANPTPLGSVKLEQGSVATGHEAIEPLIAQTVGGVTNLQADSVTDMIAGRTIKGKVKHEVGQVWGVTGKYKVLSVPVASIDDFEPACNVHVKDFFDHSAVEQSSAINQAASYARSNGKKVLVLPSGTVEYSSDITLYDGTLHIASGLTSTELKPNNGAKILSTGSFSSFENITFSSGNSQTAIEFTAIRNAKFKCCYFFEGQIKLDDFKYVNFTDCEFGNCALIPTRSDVNEISEALKVKGCNFLFGAYIEQTQCVDTVIDDCSFLGPATRQVRARRGNHVSNFYMPIFISNSVFDAAATHGVRLEGMTFKISNTWISGGRDNNGSGLSLVDCIESSLSNVQSRYCGSYGIEMFGCKNIKSSNSHFWDNKDGGALTTSSCVDLTWNNCDFGYNSTWFGGSFVQPIGIEDPALSSVNTKVIGCEFSNMATPFSLPTAYRSCNTVNGSPIDSYFAGIQTLANAAHDIGTSIARFRDIYLINNPIVGSDERLKKDIGSIPQELCDFACRTEIKQYRFKKNESGRYHYGIVITEEFLADLESIYSVSDCSAFCKSIFTDEKGNPIEIDINEDGVPLGDIWLVRYAEWQNILLEALRRKML
ncbi:intramolecular chaperone auto-processing domain protein [Vibrio phage 1.191.O._10N.286.52.B4]|nr:intramolecular chaperone auto-processing domain protein [Vibrio phage 1.191.O._10N.286.52.B4]